MGLSAEGGVTNACVESFLIRLAALVAQAEPPLTSAIPDPPGPAGLRIPTTLPVLRTLDLLIGQAPAAAASLVRELADLAPRLEWRQTYGAEEVGEAFLENYGWTELVGPRGAFVDPAVSIGFLVLGPNTLYPPHRHRAVEHYVPLSGRAAWYDEDLGWREVEPLRTLLHRSNVRHAMRTEREPLLAFFRWSGEGVGGRARIA